MRSSKSACELSAVLVHPYRFERFVALAPKYPRLREALENDCRCAVLNLWRSYYMFGREERRALRVQFSEASAFIRQHPPGLNRGAGVRQAGDHPEQHRNTQFLRQVEGFAHHLEGFLLASSRDMNGLACYYDPMDNVRKRYRDKVLKRSDDYFIDGMRVRNLDAFRAEYSSQKLLEIAASRD